MPVKTDAWAQGTPAWVDLMASDVDATKAFYAGLFGWEFGESGPEFGYYSVASLDGEPVAGLGPTQSYEGPPPAWTTYIAVDDAQALASRVAEAGGTVFAPPMAVGSFGSMALAVDPSGALFGLWQSGDHTGFNRFNEQGAVIWTEVMEGDYPGGKDFYAQVFGYTYSEIGNESFAYSMIQLDGRTVGGIGSAADIGAGAPPQWRVYFAVTDLDAASSRVGELGGSLLEAPFATEFGRMAAVSGVGGEVFWLNESEPTQGSTVTG